MSEGKGFHEEFGASSVLDKKRLNNGKLDSRGVQPHPPKHCQVGLTTLEGSQLGRRKMELKINPEYKQLLPKPSKQEYEALKESIKNEGLLKPIDINKEGVILDGHNRFHVCLELGIKPKHNPPLSFSDKLAEKKYVIVTNLQRRHLNDFQKVELTVPLLEIERELAKQRMLAGKTLSSNELGVKGQARDIVAKKIGVSPTTFQRALTIIEKGSEDLKEKVRRGKTSIVFAYKMLKRIEIDPPSLPQGVFDVIIADPPWEYYLPLRGSPDMHYSTMTTEDICQLKVPSAEDSILFLWATNPKLEDALKVMKAWGFEYKTNMVWVKDKVGTGYYFRGQHELLLVGKKGKIPTPLEHTRPSSVLEATRKEHSRKPEIAHKIIERMYPNRSYLELFARSKRQGWMSWGNDA